MMSAAIEQEAERRHDAARDPINQFQMFLLREGILDGGGNQPPGEGGERRNPAGNGPRPGGGAACAGLGDQVRLFAVPVSGFGPLRFSALASVPPTS